MLKAVFLTGPFVVERKPAFLGYHPLAFTQGSHLILPQAQWAKWGLWSTFYR